jgi:hypothetical protein
MIRAAMALDPSNPMNSRWRERHRGLAVIANRSNFAIAAIGRKELSFGRIIKYWRSLLATGAIEYEIPLSYVRLKWRHYVGTIVDKPHRAAMHCDLCYGLKGFFVNLFLLSHAFFLGCGFFAFFFGVNGFGGVLRSRRSTSSSESFGLVFTVGAFQAYASIPSRSAWQCIRRWCSYERI